MKISVVSYLNTAPLLHGILKAGIMRQHEVELDVPAVGAARFMAGEVNLALIPVGAGIVHPVNWVGNYCIGAVGEVRTVGLFSNCDIASVKRVKIDPHSRTSVLLLEVLRLHYFGASWSCVSVDKIDELVKLEPGDAALLIGDKVFEFETNFAHCYDLSEAWFRMTGLPFVFAAWASDGTVDEGFIREFDHAQERGVRSIEEVAEEYQKQKRYSRVNVLEYLRRNISYPLDDEKRKGMELFIRYARELTQSRS